MSGRSHLRDLRHKEEGDIVFENVQARDRTEFFFNKANQVDGIVLGTGDLTPDRYPPIKLVPPETILSAALT